MTSPCLVLNYCSTGGTQQVKPPPTLFDLMNVSSRGSMPSSVSALKSISDMLQVSSILLELLELLKKLFLGVEHNNES